MEPKSLMDNVKKAVNATNVGVRSAGISLLGTMYLYMGQQLSMFFENDKAALVQQINTEFSRVSWCSSPMVCCVFINEPSKTVLTLDLIHVDPFISCEQENQIFHNQCVYFLVRC